jgi:hypothetical protein
MTFDPWQPQDPREGRKPGQEQVLADLLVFDRARGREKLGFAKGIEIPDEDNNKPEEGT